jgi:phosphoglycolate phosphatase
LASSTNTFDAVLFDFDLTLADSTAGVTACANHALGVLGFPPADTQTVRKTIGLSLPESCGVLTGNADATLAQAYVRHFVEHADEVMGPLTKIFDDVPAALATLRGRGLRLAIVSTKFRYRIEAILKSAGLERAVDVIVGGEDVTRHKPHPEGLLRALRELQVEADRAVYIGDHPVDALAAAGSNLRFIAVLTGASTAEDFAASVPLGMAPDLNGAVRLLETL